MILKNVSTGKLPGEPVIDESLLQNLLPNTNKLVLAGLFIAVLSLVVGITLLSSQNDVSAQRLTQISRGNPARLGVQAIVPSTASGLQRFTVQDANAYVSTHPFPSGPTTTGVSPTVVSTSFITTKEANTRMHGEHTGLSDTALVCYVVLKGPFAMTNVSRPYGVKALPPENVGVEVFDAQTGNLLMWWAV